MRLLVCGGRRFGYRWIEKDAVGRGAWIVVHERRNALWEAIRRLDPDVVIHGDCPTGADEWAKQWAAYRGVKTQCYHADWSLGRRAGPLRNARMLAESFPTMVLAAPGGRGTADMVARAIAAGLPVTRL